MLWEGVGPPLIFIVERVCQFKFGVVNIDVRQCQNFIILVRIDNQWCEWARFLQAPDICDVCWLLSKISFYSISSRLSTLLTFGYSSSAERSYQPRVESCFKGGFDSDDKCFRLGIFRGSKVFRSFVSVLSWNKCQSVDCIENFPIYEELFCWNAQGLNGEKSSCSEY